MKFTNIPDVLPYPPSVKGILSTQHSAVVAHVVNNFRGTAEYKRKVLGVMNTLSYGCIYQDAIAANWNALSPIDTIDVLDDKFLRSKLDNLRNGSVYLNIQNVQWDVELQPIDSEFAQPKILQKSSNATTVSANISVTKNVATTNKVVANPTPKEFLYLRCPSVPMFNASKVWRSVTVDSNVLVIYETVPAVPERQCDVSVTTDVNQMVTADLMKLYPNVIINTRFTSLYQRLGGILYHENLGTILPINGFTDEQRVDNVITYPHFYKLKRIVNGELESFYKYIEIDGKLYNTMDVWDSIPESKLIPRSADFIKDYVIRRYLLERDVHKVKHNYPMYGDLGPYITLFMPAEDYIRFGYANVENIARQCVISRVTYKQSRNPIVRRSEGI